MMGSKTSPPRVSFSEDVSQDELKKSRTDTMLLDSCSDFEFETIKTSFDQPFSTADELFENGVLLPVMFQQKQLRTVNNSLPPRPKLEDGNKEIVKQRRQIISSDLRSEEKTQSKSFWGFKRSSSLNCDKRKSLISSLPIISRSNSTGSVSNPKHCSSKDVMNNQSCYKSGGKSQKPPLKKNHGVRTSPVLNVPPPYITRGAVNLFGLGSFLSSGKDKKNRK